MKPRLLTAGCTSVVMLLLAADLQAQIISLRTAPVSVSEQFFTFPSELLGMGGSYALKDLEADPFANPATASRISGTLATSMPTIYMLTSDDGFGRTLPITVFGGSETSFAGFSIAAQELEAANRDGFFGFVPDLPELDKPSRFSQNLYTFGLLGQRWPKQRTAVALSFSYARLDALHTVDLLYPTAAAVTQNGHVSDVRLGYLHEYADDHYLQAVLARNHVDMEHTVTYVDFRWLQGKSVTTLRDEFNQDNTTTWGAHVAYTRPVPESKWRIAGALTANAKTHPHIPNYQFMSIPRDPGHSWAFSFAFGAARVDSVSKLSLDFSYEPAWTYTWAEAAQQITVGTRVIPPGGVTVENDMVFSNTNLHIGWQRDLDNTVGIQLGLALRRISYWLDQYDNIRQTSREQDESWTEVTPSWGLTLDVGKVQVRYFGHLRTGVNGQTRDGDIIAPAPMPGVDIVAAPSSPLGMDVVPVIAHQFGVSIPIGLHRR